MGDEEVQILGILLVLINVATVVGPVTGVAIMYQGNMEELVIPPEMTQIINNTITVGQQTTLAEVVGAEFDNVSRKVTLTVNFTNPLNYTLTLKFLSADVVCALHNSTLGQIALSEQVSLPAAETTQAIIICNWTENAEGHIQAEHVGATSIDANLVGFTANVNDVTVETDEPIGIPNVPIA